MGDSTVINVTDLIDRRPLGSLQIRILVLCGIAALLDGLDLQSIGLAAPAMIAALHVAPRAFAAVFSAALLGLMLGAFVFGPLGDRIGRKPILIVSVLTFGLFTLGTAFVGDMQSLLVMRFLTGLGLGGAMPSFISLAAEALPHHRRAVLISVVWAGFPLGGVLGGLLASRIIPAFGWPSVFVVGGMLPLLLALVLLTALPELISFLVARNTAPARIAALLGRLTSTALPVATRFVPADHLAQNGSVMRLFSEGRGIGTLLLWATYFLIFLMLVTNSAWSPTLLHVAGIEVQQSGLAMASFNLGSVVGTSLVGLLIHRFGPYLTLTLLFLASALSMSAVGYAAPSVAMIIGLEALVGLFLGAGSSGLIALAPIYYPVAIRATGVGWATTLGRFGSFCGPLAIGSLVAGAWGLGVIYAALGAPALLAAGLIAAFGLAANAAQGAMAHLTAHEARAAAPETDTSRAV